MGTLNSLGNNVNSFFGSLLEGRSGVRFYPEWQSYNGLKAFLGAPVGDYDISRLPRTTRRAMSRMSEMAALATFEALRQAKFDNKELYNSPRVLILQGSTSGSPWTLETYFKKLFEKNGPEGQLSTSFFKTMNHSVAANVAAALEFNGSLLSVSSACATSTQAIVLGTEMIKAGLYDVVIAGGADELHYMTAAIFDIVQAASRKKDPEKASAPFDRDRDGLVVSEGAGVVILESEKHASARQAPVLAEVLGGAYFCDGSHMTQSSASTMVKVMEHSLERSGLAPDDISYINAHATGTVHGDIEEAKAIGEIFGDRVPVSSLKGHMGHSLAACGAIEMIASIKMMEDQILISNKNLAILDPNCGGIQLLQKNKRGPVKAVLSNNFAFGGMNTCLVVSAIK
jgi:3-oxoacyl-[acyl-carrier-protein] synthase II